MYKIYKTDGSFIVKQDKITKNSWIDMISPTMEEIEYVAAKTKASKELILKLLDEEEIPRVEYEDNSELIVIDCPVIEGKDNRYTTLPLGIITTDNYIITISSKKQEVLRVLRSGKIKDIKTSLKSRFIITILFQNAKLYLKYLKMINKDIDESEKELKESTDNKELLSVLNIEKSLVYFITSLKENDILIEKIFKGNIISMYEDDKDADLAAKAAEFKAQSGTDAAAARGYVDSIIAPESARKQLLYAFEMLFSKSEYPIGKKHGTI